MSWTETPHHPGSPPMCGECGQPAELVTGESIYPNSRAYHDRYFWACRGCRAWCGCHRGTTEPLGKPAAAATRAARVRAHGALDRLWKEGTATRTKAYQWLASKLMMPVDHCHIGAFDKATCDRVVSYATNEGERRFLKRRKGETECQSTKSPTRPTR